MADLFVDQDISAEAWREYEFTDPDTNKRVTYRVASPARLVIPKSDSSTHRVIDADGIMHIVPSVGSLGCVLRVSGPLLF